MIQRRWIDPALLSFKSYTLFISMWVIWIERRYIWGSDVWVPSFFIDSFTFIFISVWPKFWASGGDKTRKYSHRVRSLNPGKKFVLKCPTHDSHTLNTELIRKLRHLFKLYTLAITDLALFMHSLTHWITKNYYLPPEKNTDNFCWHPPRPPGPGGVSWWPGPGCPMSE